MTETASLTEPTAGLFDEVVSLGWRCRAARRLREYFGTARAYPFDWWVTPLEGAIRFFHDWDVETLYRPDRLERTWQASWPPQSYVRNRDYGIVLAHEFPLAGFEAAGRSLHMALPGWRGRTAEPMARTAHLMRQFEALDRPGLRVLFVRHLAPGEGGEPAALEALRQAVVARAGACRPTFLLISAEGAQAPGWLSLAIDDRSRHWAGDAALWDAGLAGLGFRLKRPRDEAGMRSHRKAQKRAKQRARQGGAADG